MSFMKTVPYCDTVPVIIDSIQLASTKYLFEYVIKVRGATFCQVIRVKDLIQGTLRLTTRNQACRGAAPILVKNTTLSRSIRVILGFSMVALITSTAEALD